MSGWRRPLGEYDGRLMRCAPGTHEAAMRLVMNHVPSSAKTLDLAAGTGAFLARLRDRGFANLHAVELNVAGFRFEGVTPTPVDLNGNFSGAIADDFGFISAIEIIEHLDCPRNFLRQVHQALEPGGYLLLTTPNIASWLGRLRFFLSGELRQFQRHDYDYQRHISPLTDIQLRLIFEELGFKLIGNTTAGSFFGPMKAAVFSPIMLAAKTFLGPRSIGDVAVYLVRKSAAASTSAGRNSLYFQTTGA